MRQPALTDGPLLCAPLYRLCAPYRLSLPQIQMTKMKPGIKTSACSCSYCISLQTVSFNFAFFLMIWLMQWSYDHCMPFPRRGEHRVLNISALKCQFSCDIWTFLIQTSKHFSYLINYMLLNLNIKITTGIGMRADPAHYSKQIRHKKSHKFLEFIFCSMRWCC